MTVRQQDNQGGLDLLLEEVGGSKSRRASS